MDPQIFCVDVWNDFLFIKLYLNACDFPLGLSLKDVSVSNSQFYDLKVGRAKMSCVSVPKL